MPNGKPAGVRCIHLDAELRCGIFNDATRPRVCGSLKPEPQMCGHGAEKAIEFLTQLELATRP